MLSDTESEDVLAKTFESCPECGHQRPIVDYERGEHLCPECGSVLSDFLPDLWSNSTAFDTNEEETQRNPYLQMKTNIRLGDKCLGTIIGLTNKDSYNNNISAATRFKMNRLRRVQNRDHDLRSLNFALSELERIASELGLSNDVRKAAAFIYRRASKQNFVRGRSIEAVVASALRYACKQNKIPITLDEFANQSRITRRELSRTYRAMLRDLNLPVKITEPEQYVARYCSELDLDAIVQSKVMTLLEQARAQNLLSGSSSQGIVGATIYIASILCGQKRKQKEIATVAGISEVTIRNKYKKLCEKLGFVIDVNGNGGHI